jgi:hypothetical protein
MVLKEEPVEADQIQKVMASESALLPAVAASPLTPSSWTGVMLLLYMVSLKTCTIVLR